MKKLAELVFISSPGWGHLIPNIEFAKRLLDRNDRLSVTVLVIKPVGGSGSENTAYPKTLSAADTRIRFIDLPQMNPPSQEASKSPEKFLMEYVDCHKSYAKEAIIKHILSGDSESDSVPLAGLVLDLFCMSMIDMGYELGVPSYLFLTSGAAFLGLLLYLSNRDGKEFEESDFESADILTYENAVPYRVLPSFCFNQHGGYTSLQSIGIRIKELKGIFVNTCEEFESYAVNSVVNHDHIPPVYAVGPLIDLACRIQPSIDHGTQRYEIIKWLDEQAPSSVVFLCFGSRGAFPDEQLKEIALGLEQTGRRFLWSVRKPPPPNKYEMPREYTCVDEILPHGFRERTNGQGILCGWAPQKEILAHRSIGGFVSHCGWNSVLESVWYGVPLVTWPLYAEQQINAFQMVRDMGLAVEMRLDYRVGSKDLVLAGEITRAIRCLMDGGDEVRKRVREVSEKSRLALMEGGSSFIAYGRLIEDVLKNIP